MGAYLQSPNKAKQISSDSNSNLQYLSIGMQGWRTSMEDSSIEALSLDDQGTCVFGVFDGHGGSEVATYVSQHFISTLKSNSKFKQKNYIDSLKETFLQIDKDMQTESGKKELQLIKSKDPDSSNNQFCDNESQAGCTANVVLISFPQNQQKQIICANSGDARSIVVSSGKNITHLSQDHKPDLPMEKERILRAGGFVSEGRINANLNLSRAFGDFEYKNNQKKSREEQILVVDPDICNFKSQGNERWTLIGCDGVWEMLPVEKIVDIVDQKIEKGEDNKKIMEDLFEELIAKDTMNGAGCDNMTAILINFKKKGKK